MTDGTMRHPKTMRGQFRHIERSQNHSDSDREYASQRQQQESGNNGRRLVRRWAPQ